MSNDADELQRLQIAAAKVMGIHSELIGPYWYIVRADSPDRFSMPCTNTVGAWAQFHAFCKWGISADANRELLEWLADADSPHGTYDRYRNYIEKCVFNNRGTYNQNTPFVLEVQRLSPFDVLRAFVAATTEGDENG